MRGRQLSANLWFLNGIRKGKQNPPPPRHQEEEGMNRRYVNIRPKSSDSGGPSQSDNPGDDQTTSRRLKKRQVISVACDRCRRRKIRCDGNRPTCSGCVGISDKCTYRDHPNLSQEARRIIVEVVDILSNLPDGSAADVLKRLQGESDAAAIMTRLRESGASDTTMSQGSADTNTQVPLTELQAQNPAAYPSLSLDDINGSVEDTAPELAEFSGAATPWSMRDSQSDSSERPLCDPRLGQLNIANWSQVPIDSTAAAQAISLYLETDHPLLGFFEPDSFVASLTNPDTAHCSPVLVSALMYWATQMYSAIDDRVGSFANQFGCEAEERWKTEQDNDTILNVATAQLLSLGYLGQGKDHAVLQYLSQASSMATRLGLFSQDHETDMMVDGGVSPTSLGVSAQLLYAAWGAFNWITLVQGFH
jgi:hypothetical protein